MMPSASSIGEPERAPVDDLKFVRECLRACPSLGCTHVLCDGAVIVKNTVRINTGACDSSENLSEEVYHFCPCMVFEITCKAK